MLRSLVCAALVCAGTVVSAGAQEPLPATDVTAAQMQAFLEALPRNEINDMPVRTVDVGGHRVGVYGVFRPKDQPGDAIAHETRTSEVYFILEGSGTLVTGGTIANPRPVPANRTAGPRGEKIDGGVSRHVAKGDLIIIPGRTPHWWSSLDGDIRYMIIRSDPDSRMRLK
jgi:mannose-6-phosphate isomerase-like protein (cupin superfamily)